MTMGPSESYISHVTNKSWMWFAPDQETLLRDAREYLGTDDIETVKTIGLGYLMAKFPDKISKDLKLYRYYNNEQIPLGCMDNDSHAFFPTTATFTYKDTKIFTADYNYPNYAECAVAFTEKGKGIIIKEFIKFLASLQKTSHELWMWGNKWLPLDKLDTSSYIVPSTVKAVFDSQVKSQLDNKEVFNHVLFYSPPGMGKTAFVRYLAKEYQDWTFVTVSPGMFEKPTELVALFNDAERYQPSVLYFEDIDTIGQHRDMMSEHFNPFLGAILNAMDGMESVTKTLVIGSTNNATALDPALLRAGRFGIHIPFNYTKNERVDILNRYLKSSYTYDEVRFVTTLAPTDIRSIAKTSLAKSILIKEPLTPEFIQRTMMEVLSEERVEFKYNPIVGDKDEGGLGPSTLVA